MPHVRARALGLFDLYADMPHHRQSRALAQLKLEDPALHDALVDLLAADALENVLDVPAIEVLAALNPNLLRPQKIDPESRIGTTLGAWRIHRLVDVGGMGTVYEACRADGQYTQRAALKCIRAELSSPALIHAFRVERTHLAQLEHPHIAALLDGGVESDGLPWFAMRYVDGSTIDAWCDQREAGVRERVTLLVQACEALSYAHRQRVLHQDVKPANLLVTPQGHVFLVDFGLSASLGQGGEPDTPRIAISNGYAAPEILDGGRATFASDLYALGAVMYRLLCADLPLPLQPIPARRARLPGDARPRSLVALLEHAPGSVARLRGRYRTRSLARELSGDLDAIALKCVQPDPALRYASVDALRDDLVRWLQRRPVRARDGGWGYRATRFAQRHAWATALGVLAGMSMLGGTATLAWQYMRRDDEAYALQQVSALFEDMLGTATLSGLGDAGLPPRELLARTEARLRAQSLDRHPSLKAHALSTLARSHAAVGDYPHALALATEASLLTPDDPSQRIETSATLAALLNLQARHAEARDVAMAGIQQRRGKRPGVGMLDVQLLTELARAQWGLSEHDAAFATLAMAQQAARSVRDDALPQPADELLVLRAQWEVERHELPAARRHLQEAIARGGAHPATADAAREYLIQLLAQTGDTGDALLLSRVLLQKRRQRLGEAHPDTARSWRLLAEQLYLEGDDAAAEPVLTRARTLLQHAYGREHPAFAEAVRLESLLLDRQHRGRGIAKMREAIALFDRRLGPLHPATLRAKVDLARQLMTAAHTSSAAQGASLDEAIMLLQEAVHTFKLRRLPMPAYKLELAQALMRRDHRAGDGGSDLAQAEATLQDGLVEALRSLGATHSTTLQLRTALMQLKLRQGRADEADHIATRVIADAGTRLPEPRARQQIEAAQAVRAKLALRRPVQAPSHARAGTSAPSTDP